MQLFYLLHNRRTLMYFFGLIIFNIYMSLKISSIDINIRSIMIQALLAYMLFNFSLYVTLFNRDNLLGRFEHYIATGYKLSDILFLRALVISILSIVATAFIFLINVKIYDFREIIIESTLKTPKGVKIVFFKHVTHS